MGAAVGVYLKLTGNVRHIPITGEDLGATRPPKLAGTAMNVLIVGSDQRDGKNAKYREALLRPRRLATATPRPGDLVA